MRGAPCLRALRAHLATRPNNPPDVADDGSVSIDGTTYKGEEPTGYRSSQQGIGVYSLAAVVLLVRYTNCLLYTSPSPRDQRGTRMPSSA